MQFVRSFGTNLQIQQLGSSGQHLGTFEFQAEVAVSVTGLALRAFPQT